MRLITSLAGREPDSAESDPIVQFTLNEANIAWMAGLCQSCQRSMAEVLSALAAIGILRGAEVIDGVLVLAIQPDCARKGGGA